MTFRNKAWFSLMLALILLVSTAPIYAAEPSSDSYSPPIGKVNIDDRSRVELTNVQMIPNQNQKTIAYTIRVVNDGTKDIDFYDYWTRIRLNNGSVLSVKPFGNRANDKIAPQTEKQYTFYTMVNTNTKYSDVSIQILKWDFSQTDFTRVLGTISIPDNYDPVYGPQTVTVDNTVLQIGFNNVKQSQVNDNVRLTFDAEFFNSGNRSVTIPSFKYYIMNKEGLMYELTIDTGKSTQQAQPKSKAKIRLKGEVAEGVELDDAKFVISEFDQQANSEIPVATVYIDLTPTVQSDTSLSVATEKEVVIGDNTYHLKLDSVQQLPWEDENIISAQLTVSNKTKEALPLPNLKAIFSFDDVELSGQDTKIVQLDGGIGIPAGKRVRYAVFVKIPYTYEFNRIALEFLAVSNDSGDVYEEELLTYSVPKSAFRGYVQVLEGRKYNTDTTGKSAGYLIKSLNVYQGTNTSIYNTLLEVENRELRTTTLSDLIGYFKSVNGTLYPAVITKVETGIFPSAKVLLSVSAKIPTKANTNDLRLILAELDTANDAYYSAAEFRLPVASSVGELGVMRDKEIYPYNFSINTLHINLSNNAEVRFQYTLDKSHEYEYTPEGHTIVIELVDGEVKYTQEYAFEKELKLGTNWGSMIAQMEIDNPTIKLQNIDGFKINVYDQYQGHKRLLISRDVHAIYVR